MFLIMELIPIKLIFHFQLVSLFSLFWLQMLLVHYIAIKERNKIRNTQDTSSGKFIMLIPSGKLLSKTY